MLEDSDIERIATAVAAKLGAVDKSVFNTKEAATYLGVAVETLEVKRSIGGGPRFSKIGRSVRYRRADLDEWLASGLKRHTSEVTQ